MSMMGAVENIVIRIREDGVPMVRAQINNLRDATIEANNAFVGLDRSMQMVRRTMGFLLTGLGLDKLRQYADHWIAIQNRIRVFTSSLEEAKAVHQKLFTVVQESRQEFDPLVQLYSRSAQAAETLGASQNQLIGFTEAVAKSLAIQGVTTTQARGALIQLGQAMGMAKLRAQEFNSINEQAPIILQTIAKQIYGVTGSVAQLRSDMTQGKVLSKDVFEAFMKGLPQIREQFKLVAPTIGQSFTVFNNAFGRMIGLLDAQFQISANVSRGIIYLANNIDILAKSMLALSPIIWMIIGPTVLSALNALVGAFIRLNLAILANPFASLARFAVIAASAIIAFKDDIVLLKSEVDGMDRNIEFGVSIDVTAADYISALFDEWNKATDNYNFTQWFNDVAISWSLLVDAITSSYNVANNWLNEQIAQLVRNFQVGYAAIEYYWMYMCNRIEAFFVSMLETIVNGLNSFVDTFNSISSNLNIPEIPKIEIGVSTKDYEDGASELKAKFAKTQEDIANSSIWTSTADSITNGATNSFSQMLDGVVDTFKGKMEDLKGQAILNSVLRNTKLEQDTVDLDKLPQTIPNFEAGDKDKKGKGVDKLRNQLLALMRQLDPVKFAILDMAKAEDTLTKAQQKGMITLAERDQYLKMLPEHFDNAMRPFEAMIAESLRESAVLRENIADQETFSTVYAQVLELKKQGITVTEEQIEQLAKQAEVTKFLNDINERSVSLYQNSISQRTEGQAQQFLAVNRAMEQGILSAQQYQVEMGKIAIELGKISAASGKFEIDAFFNGSMAGVMDGYNGVLVGLQDTFSTFYGSISEGVANSLSRAIVYSDNLGDSLLNVAKTVTTQLLASLIQMGIQYMVNAALATSAATAQTAASVVQAKLVAAAWAPAATMVSLASFGTNSAAAISGISLTSLFATMTAMKGFQKGGFTGAGSDTDVKGLVHGNEYVFDAPSVRRLGLENLESLKNTGTMGNPNVITSNQRKAGGSGLTVNVQNYGTSKEFEVEWTENELRIIARDEAKKEVNENAGKAVARDMAKPNSEISKATTTNFNTSRKR